MRLMITAGFDRSLPALAMAELLRRESFEIAGVLVVTPWGLERIRSRVRGIRIRDVVALSRKLGGQQTAGPMKRFLEEKQISPQPITQWAKPLKIPVMKVKDLNDDEALQFIRSRKPDWIVYAGGGILRKRLLTGGTWRVMNAHSGPLPEIRGMNAAEWAVLLGLEPSVTIHLIDEGIDTGSIIRKAPVDLSGITTVEDLRQRAVVEGISGIVSSFVAVRGGLQWETPVPAPLHRQCFTLSPALKELVEVRLTSRHRRA